jgi:hypothetical protein
MKRDEARIQSPCHESWDDMTGDDARRYCGKCDKHVHNLSAMTEDEARSVAAQRNVCVRYSFNPRTRSIQHQPSRRVVLRTAAAVTLTAGLALPAVASISTEPGEVGLLQTAWEALTSWADGEVAQVQGGIMATPDDGVEELVMGEMPEDVPEVEMGDIAVDVSVDVSVDVAVEEVAPVEMAEPARRESIRMGRIARPATPSPAAE